MAVPFNDLKRRFLPQLAELQSTFSDVIHSGILIGGANVANFEHAFADYCGTANCVAVANGTDALEIALRGLEVGVGDEVVAVANAGGYASVACQAVGATPVYIDVDSATCQMDLAKLATVVGPATQLVVITHLYGFMNDVAAVRKQISELGRGDIKILEDCAQSHGAEYGGQPCGSLADAATFSFYPTKNLGALGDAGAIVCQDDGLATRLRQLAQYGWSSKYLSVVPAGRNSRMDPMQAAFLQQQLPALRAGSERRRQICSLYAQHLPTGWHLVHDVSSRFVGHLAVAIAPTRAALDEARQLLSKRGIAHEVHYPVLDCDQPGWRRLGRLPEELNESRRLLGRYASLPCFPELVDSELEQVVDAISAFPRS
jgi:dTDP-3-amino-2,3,6-trideoxy-4-keto-D-glucose/dTDP-3-amino-3,4,6-trideoxy-alpha-D-glucose/dTDP-2,6-dideoxy-D-kanosamine transaminase